MIDHKHNERVRYGMTDQMGVMYYGQYPLFYEIGRVELMRDMGIRYRDIENELGIVMPVLEVHAKYLKPARYDDLVTIHTKISSVPSKILDFETDLYVSSTLIHTAQVRLGFLDLNKKRLVSCPITLMETIIKFKDNQT